MGQSLNLRAHMSHIKRIKGLWSYQTVCTADSDILGPFVSFVQSRAVQALPGPLEGEGERGREMYTALC